LRFAEIALFAAPFLVFAAWRLMAPSGDAPKSLVFGVIAAVVAMAGLLLILWYEDAAPPNSGYIPARIVDGRIIPGQVVPPRDTGR
jgi:peptidoglycan/LPS O-acetylase OafA/YrhL